ncbi:Annexin protein, partial [Phytophthora megakarya]
SVKATSAAETSAVVSSADMRSLYARSARESSSIESMTFATEIDTAAQEIKRVCTGAASDESALASLLLSKTVEQRYLIWWRYHILYKQSLTVWVKSTSDYGILLKMLASPLEHVEAEILRKATKGMGTTEEWIYPVVMARSNSEIALLKKTFQEKYGEDLVKVLSSDLSGDLKKVILTAMRGEVADFNATVHTSAKAAADADALYKAGEGRMGTDEATFISILVLSPAEHVRSINSAYMSKYKTNLVGAINAEFSGDAKRALLFLVRSVLDTEEMLAELFETTLKGGSKNAYGLSAWVVRYYRLLVRIRIVYSRVYRQELRTRIQGVMSGEYCQLLLSVLDAAEVEFGASASGSVSASGAMSASGAAMSASGAMSSSSTVVSGSSAAVSGAAIHASSSVEEKTSTLTGSAVSGSGTESASSDGSVEKTKVVMSTASEASTIVSTTIVRTVSFDNIYAQSAHDVAEGATFTLYADIEAAVEEIREKCTGGVADERALASILVTKTSEQRYLIWWRYHILYKQSLTVWVKSTSDYGILLKMLASPLEHVEAEILRKATKGMGTTEEWIYPVVMARSNREIAMLKKIYRDLYNDDLMNILRGELSGDLRKVVMAAMKGDLPRFDPAVHTSAKAAADADELYKVGEGKWGTDEEPFIRIVVASPAEHLRNIDAAYSKKYKKTNIIKAIKGEFKGDAQMALLYHVRMIFEPFELLADLFESTMKGLGTDEYGLSAAVVRYHMLLPQIKSAYKKQYGKELSKRIRGDTSGEYRDLLLAIVDGQ